MCYRGGKNVAGVNLIFYFECKSYRLSFSSVFRSVLKVTEIEARVWVNHRCLYITLGRVCWKAVAGIMLLLFFFTHWFCSVGWGDLVPWAGQMSALQWYVYILITFVIRREGTEKRTRKKVWEFFSASQFRFCFDTNPKIQTFLWNESAVGVGRAKSWAHGNRGAIQKFSLQPFPGFTYFLHLIWTFLFKFVGIFLSEIKVWGVVS